MPREPPVTRAVRAARKELRRGRKRVGWTWLPFCISGQSKSLGNAIGIQEPAGEMYGKLMSISDELMWKYYTFLTDLRRERDRHDAVDEVSHGGLHPMVVKKDLAWSIVPGLSLGGGGGRMQRRRAGRCSSSSGR